MRERMLYTVDTVDTDGVFGRLPDPRGRVMVTAATPLWALKRPAIPEGRAPRLVGPVLARARSAVRLSGTNHVNLTVSDLERSTEWYCRVLGLTPVSNHENIGPPYFNDNTYRGLFDLRTASYVIGLIQHAEPLRGAFDARRVGLDHVGFHVPDRVDLDAWADHLTRQGVTHTGIVEAPYASVISFRDPDGIALELSAADLEFWGGLVARAMS
jgi:glyoxylase I family protein